MNTVVIECDRLILRNFKETDLDDIYNITLQPEIAKFLPDWIATKERRKEWLAKYEIPENNTFIISMPHISDCILRLAITLKESNELIGWIVSGLKYGVPAPNREIGYAISNKYINNGYATEAVKGLIEFLFDNTDTTELVAIALIENTASNCVIKKSGFQYKGIIEIEGKDYHYYRTMKYANASLL